MSCVVLTAKRKKRQRERERRENKHLNGHQHCNYPIRGELPGGSAQATEPQGQQRPYRQWGGEGGTPFLVHKHQIKRSTREAAKIYSVSTDLSFKVFLGSWTGDAPQSSSPEHTSSWHSAHLTGILSLYILLPHETARSSGRTSNHSSFYPQAPHRAPDTQWVYGTCFLNGIG